MFIIKSQLLFVCRWLISNIIILKMATEKWTKPVCWFRIRYRQQNVNNICWFLRLKSIQVSKQSQKRSFNDHTEVIVYNLIVYLWPWDRHFTAIFFAVWLDGNFVFAVASSGPRYSGVIIFALLTPINDYVFFCT